MPASIIIIRRLPPLSPLFLIHPNVFQVAGAADTIQAPWRAMRCWLISQQGSFYWEKLHFNKASSRKLSAAAQLQQYHATQLSFIWLFLRRSERRGYPVSPSSTTGESSENRTVNISINWWLLQQDLNCKSLWYISRAAYIYIPHSANSHQTEFHQKVNWSNVDLSENRNTSFL